MEAIIGIGFAMVAVGAVCIASMKSSPDTCKCCNCKCKEKSDE